jgi:hypothetical protein
VRIEPDVGPSHRKSCAHRGGTGEPRRQVGRFEGFALSWMESRQIGSMKNVRRHRDHARVPDVPAPAWMSAIEAPSECPTRIASSIPSRWRSFGQRDERFVVHEAHVARGSASTSDLAVTVAVVDERLAAGRGGRLHVKVAPLPDRAHPSWRKISVGLPGSSPSIHS